MPDASHGHGRHGDGWHALITDPERIANATPETVMPVFQAMMRGGCRGCPSTQTRACQNTEKPFNVVGHTITGHMMSMPWQFKAQDIIGGGASDGGVPHAVVRQVVSAVEATARRNDHDVVSLADIVETVAAMATDFEYHPPMEQDTEFLAAVGEMGSPTEVIARGKRDSRARAEEYRADPQQVRLNAMEIIAGLPYEEKVHGWMAEREMNWCSHVPHLYSRMLWRTGMTDEEILPLFDTTEAIARERGHTGVTPRDVETAFMRAAATGVMATEEMR